MKKLLLGLVLAAVPLMGCGAGVEESAADNVRTVTSESGLVMNIDEGPMSSLEPLASMQESSGEVTAMDAQCWVTLLYCRDPRYGGRPTCQSNGHCTNAQIQKNCEALYQKNC